MPNRLETNPVHLGLGSTAVVEPEFTGMDWYDGYMKRHAADGKEGRLVSLFTFGESWDAWEMHPSGAEVVLCTAGKAVIVQEVGGAEIRTELAAGEYVINDPGVWHTMDVTEAVTCLFITAGEGTEHRVR